MVWAKNKTNKKKFNKIGENSMIFFLFHFLENIIKSTIAITLTTTPKWNAHMYMLTLEKGEKLSRTSLI